MENFLFLSEFFGGIILVFVIGYLIGHLLKFDKYLTDSGKDGNKDNQNGEREKLLTKL